MVASLPIADFEALDACHRQILKTLQQLAALGQQLETEAASPATRAQARAIDAFFSGVAHEHHTQEEETVFPPLLESGDAELVQAVRRLQQDHGWIERDWALLGPQLRAIADGQGGLDPDAFRQCVDVFVQLYLEHIALEETLVYPQAKSRWEMVVAQRKARPGL